MTFTPVVPFGGYSGWSFLTRTLPAQQKAFEADPVAQRDETYFRDNIAKADTPEKLVADRRLLSVALTAFGLEGDINNKYFIKKVLEDGTLDPAALGNRLSDKRYQDFSKAFGFGDFAVANTQLSDFPDKVLKSYETRRFETAVGAQDDDMRLALNAKRELGELATRKLSENGKWFTALGSAPLRTVLQTALGLPGSFSNIDLDKQLDILKDYGQKYLGSPDISQFSEPENVEKLIRLFLVRSQAQSISISGSSAALTLLQQAGSSGNFLSRYV